MKELTFFEQQKLYIESIDKLITNAHNDHNYEYLIRLIDDLCLERDVFNRNRKFMIATNEDINNVITLYSTQIDKIKLLLKDERYKTF